MKAYVFVIQILILAFCLASLVPAATLEVVSNNRTIWTNNERDWSYSTPVKPHPAWPVDMQADSKAEWIWSYDGEPGLKDFGPLHFRQFLNVPPCSGKLTGTLRINADNGYIVYLNGKLLGSELGQDIEDGNPLDWLWVKGARETGQHFWSKSKEYKLTDKELVSDTNILDIYVVNWIAYRTANGRWTYVGVGDLNPGAMCFAAEVNYSARVHMKVTPDTLFTASSGKSIKVRVDGIPETWRSNWKELKLNGVIAPTDAKFLGGAALIGAMELSYDRSEVQDFVKSDLSQVVWPKEYTLWLDYLDFYGEDQVKLGSD